MKREPRYRWSGAHAAANVISSDGVPKKYI